MTLSVTTITNEQDSARAGTELGGAIRNGLNGAAADAVIVFASAQHDYERLLRALAHACGTDVIVGFRVPYIKGPDTEPLEKKIEHLERFAESVIAKVKG